MKILTIVRHAKSSWGNPGLQDHERPLNSRGKRDAPAMGRRLAEAGICPGQIIASPAVRAWTTATIIIEALGIEPNVAQQESSLYLASIDDMLDVIVAQNNSVDSLMIVAHNPGLTDFANYLSPGLTNNLPTAGVVSVTIDQDNWSLYERPATELVLYDYPQQHND